MAVSVRLTVELNHVDVESFKGQVVEYTTLAGVFERFPPGQVDGAATDVVPVRGDLDGRGVAFERSDRGVGQHVPVLGGVVSLDGTNLSGTIEDCGAFSLRRVS